VSGLEPAEISVLLLCQDDAQARALEALLEPLGLAVDLRATSWPVLRAALERVGDEPALVVMSLASLCADGVEALMEADGAFLMLDEVQPVLLVEPWVQREVASVQAMTGFRHLVQSAQMEAGLPAAARQAFPEVRFGREEGSPGLASPPSGPRSTSVVREIASIRSGSLTELSLSRVLYSIYVRGFSGRLVLRGAQREQAFWCRDGQLGGDNVMENQLLMSAFAWTSGSYELRAEPVPGSFVGFGSTLQRIYDGCARFVSLNQAAERLQGWEDRFPIVTRFWGERIMDLGGLPILRRFCDLCDGNQPWGELLKLSWQDVQVMLKAAYYAVETDLVVFERHPVTRNVARVQYTTRSTHGLRRVPRGEARQPEADAARRAEEEALLAKLQTRAQKYGQEDPYAIFGLWSGCGPEATRSRFYELVKLHHPDVYGSCEEPRIRAAAEEIFILIKDAYVAILDKEGGRGLVPSPSERHAPSSGPRSSPARPVTARIPTPTTPSAPSRAVTPPPAAPPRVEEAPPSRSPRSRPTPPPTEDSGIRKRRDLGPASRRVTPTSAPDDTPARPARLETPRPSRPSEAPSRPERRPTSEGHALPPRPPRPATGERPLAPQSAPPEPSPSSPRAPRPSREELSLRLTPAQHFEQGLKLLKGELKERARAAFLLALEGEPQNPRYRAYAAWINYLNDPERAFAHSFKVLNELVDEQRDAPRPLVEARLFLARILERQGDDEKAARAFRAVLKADAGNVEAQRFLRLHEMRKKEGGGQESSFFGKLFQKKK
jgi:hypothetical protein